MSDYLHGISVLVGSPLGPGYYVGSSSTRTLRKGMSGEDVRALQQALIAAGFPVGTKGADGAYGEDTFKAVWNFQTAKKLSVDGIAGSETLAALNVVSSPVPASTPTVSSTSGSRTNVSVESPEVPSDGSLFTRKYGPLPVYGWGLIAVALGLGTYIALPRRSSVS